MRWIYIFAGILAIGFGLSLEYRTLPNQEINLQFTPSHNHTASSETISRFKNGLQKIGASQISIKNHGAGVFQISYFSKLDVTFVKILLEREGIALSETAHTNSNGSIPTEKSSEPSKGQFRISKIQKSSKSDAFGDGVLVAPQRGTEAVYHPILYAAYHSPNVIPSPFVEIRSITPISRITIVRGMAPYTFPEVRAGPLA